MAAPTKKIFSVGLNAARIYALDTNGYPAATTHTAPYDGLAVGGPISFALTIPDPTQVAHPGNNAVLQYDMLPSIDVSSGTLTVSRQDDDTIVALNNTKVHVVGESNIIGWNTSQEGLQATVALVVYQQAKDNSGNRRWHTYVMPRTIIAPKPAGMQRERQDITYVVQPQNSTEYLTGLDFSLSNNGFTYAQVIDYQSNYRLHFAAWKLNGSETVFTFDTNLQAANTTGMVVYKNGTALASPAAVTLATDKVTLASAGTSGDMLVVMYELADTAIDVG